MMDYGRAIAWLNAPRRKDRTRIGHETYLSRTQEGVALEYRESFIVTYRPNGDLWFHNRGYQTRTTKDRYNRFLPPNFWVYEHDKLWFLQTPSGTRPFRNGMVVKPSGWVEGFPAPFYEIDARDLYDRTRRYARDYTDVLTRGLINRPRGEGDCPKCYYVLFELTGGNTIHDEAAVQRHLLEHVQEQSTPGSLIALAAARHAVRGYPTSTGGLFRYSPSFAAVVEVCWPDSQKLRKKPRTKAEKIEQVELRMLRNSDVALPNIQPRYWRREIASVLKHFLLEKFEFGV